MTFGCDNDDSNQDNCSLATVLTDDDFEYRGTTYSIVGLFWDSVGNTVSLQVAAGGSALSGSATKTALGALTLNVQGNAFAISGSETATAEVQFSYTPATAWTDGLAVSVSLTRPASTDATLSDLSASTSTSARGLFTSLDIGRFASGTTSYRGSVGNPVTHVKLTPTVNDPDATVKVGKQGATLATVASGSASGAIPLSVGSNAITVEVTADGTTQTYTVTVTRLGAAAVATVTLSASPTQVWEGQASRVTATLSHALPHGVLIPVTVTPCPTGSWCKRWNNYGIHITAGDTVGHLKGPVNPSADKLTDIVVDGYHEETAGGFSRFVGVKTPVYTGPQTSLLTVRDADAEDEEITVALGSPLPRNVIAGSKTSQKIRVLDPDRLGLTLTADRQPVEGGGAEGGGKVTVTLDLGVGAPAGFWATLRTSGGTATYGKTVPSITNYDSCSWQNPCPQIPDWSTDVEGRDDLTQQYHGNDPQYGRLVYMRDWGGASKKTITLTIADDPDVDPGETIVLQATGYGFPVPVRNRALESNELTLTIKDNDGDGTAADDRIVMGALPTYARESGTGADSTARVPVWLSRPATQQVTVPYQTVPGTTTTGVDYTHIPQNTLLTFAPGEVRKEIEITIKDDNVEDSGETFYVSFGDPKPTSLVRWQGDIIAGGTQALPLTTFRFVTVTIINDEADLEGLKLWGAPGSGGPFARLDLGAFDGAVSDYAVTVPHGTTHAKLAGIAPQNEHLGLKAGRAGSTLTAVRSNVAGPAVPLAVGDTVLVVQSTASTGERKTYRVTVTREAQAAVAVSLSATPNPVDEGAAVTVRATLATALAQAVTIPLTVTRGTSEDGDHGSLASIEIPAGGTSATGTITTSDDTDGDDETFTVALGSLPSGLAAGSASSVEVTITDKGAQQQQRTEPLTAAFEGVPSEHDGTAFTFDLTLSEAPGDGNLPAAASFKVAPGKASVSGSGTRYTVTVTPKAANAWKDVTVTLAGGRACSEAGAICTADGRALSNTSSTTVGGPVRIRVEGARAKEGKDESLDFAVTLNRAAAHDVSVDYATADETATAGADYTATSGTLVFAAGETAKTVKVPVLDDAVDEGKEVMRLLLSNPRGAYLRGVHSKAKGVIRNDDALQKLWLSRFGRTVASQTVAALEGRFATPSGAPSHVTMAGVDLLSAAGDDAALGETLTGLAQAFGAPSAPAGDPGSVAGAGSFGRDHHRSSLWNEPVGASAPARGMTARGLLAGSSFRFAAGDALDPGGAMTGWGKVVSGGSDGSSLAGLSYASETATGILGMDWERNRLLVGVALSRSLETGRAQEASGTRYDIEGELSTVAPYMRVQASERLSFWSALGSGEGSMALSWGGVSQKADISMQLAAAGGRAELLRPDSGRGFALALKGDAFFVRTESARVSAPGVGNLAASAGDASRVRAVLEGSRSFGLAGGGELAPSLSLGLRHDGGDAETGTGVEAGAGLSWSDPARGLTSDLRLYGLAAHEADGYGEWGASGSLRLVPDPSGRGLSLSMTPSWGAQGQTGRLWDTAPKSFAGTGGGEQPGGRLDTEVGYGLSAPGGTGTPYAGIGLGDSGARDWRLGWRFTSERLQSLSLGVEAIRREAANDNGSGAEHGVTVRGALRW